MIRTQDLYDIREAISNALVKFNVTSAIIQSLNKDPNGIFQGFFYEDKVYEDVMSSLENAFMLMSDVIFEREQEENFTTNAASLLSDEVPF